MIAAMLTLVVVRRRDRLADGRPNAAGEIGWRAAARTSPIGRNTEARIYMRGAAAGVATTVRGKEGG
jgi:hypothetical protein